MRRLLTPRPSSFITAVRSARDARHAGTIPARSAAPAVASTTKSSTVPSRRMSIQNGGSVSAIARLKSVTPSCAMASPAAPPTAASVNTSTSICLITRARPAPSAPRIAISRVRSAARASVRLATLAHAMRRTPETAASIVNSMPTTSDPRNSAISGFTCVV
jgi:hypothetical protein